MFIHKKVILVVMFMVAVWQPGISAQNTSKNNRGITIFYRYQFNNSWGDLLDNPHISAGRKQAYWKEVNPAEGEFDWQVYDEAIQKAQSVGKKAVLALSISGYGGWNNPNAADGVPVWVYENGEGLGVDYLEWNGPPYTKYPIFWSENIKTHFQTLIEKFGARYNNHPCVEYVIIGLYPEMNLGKDANNLQQDWLNAGYTDSLYENTVKWYIDLYTKNFPDTQFSLACLSSKPIGTMSTSRFEELRNTISAYLNSIPNGGIENNAMRDLSSWGFIQQWFREYYQTTYITYEAVDKSDVAGGRGGNFRFMLENGLTAHADYFQLYYEDILIATPGTPDYDPEYENALTFAAKQIGLEPEDSLRNNVWIRFNALNSLTGSGKFFFQGLYCDENAPFDSGAWPEGKIRPSNGEYLPVDSIGFPAHECIKTNQASGDNFIYLDIDDGFIFGGNNFIEIKIEYFDKGTDKFLIDYDGINNPYSQSDFITKTNLNTWKTAVIKISNSVLANNQIFENDIRINSNADGDEYISFVQVTKSKDPLTTNALFPSLKPKIYPNSTNRKITVEMENINNIKVYNILGEEILTVANSNVVDLINQPEGVYFLRISCGYGEKTAKVVLIE